MGASVCEFRERIIGQSDARCVQKRSMDYSVARPCQRRVLWTGWPATRTVSKLHLRRLVHLYSSSSPDRSASSPGASATHVHINANIHLPTHPPTHTHTRTHTHSRPPSLAPEHSSGKSTTHHWCSPQLMVLSFGVAQCEVAGVGPLES